MVYTEVVILKSRKGKALETVRDAFDEKTVDSGAMVIRQTEGRIIIYDFSTWKAQHWRPGSLSGRRISDINKINL
jgi:hypothetical protein